MEVILGIIMLVVVWFVISLVLKTAARAGKATVDTIAGKGSVSENFNTQFRGMGEFRTKVTNETITNEGVEFSVFKIRGRGLFPIRNQTEISFVTSILDTTDPQMPYPVLSMLDSFQEQHSRAFLSVVNYGSSPPNVGWPDWVDLNIAIKDTLVFPESGRRTLTFITRVVNTDSLGLIDFSFIDPAYVFGSSEISHYYDSTSHGYKDFEKNTKEAQEISIQLAVHTAMSDEVLHNDEGQKIKIWIERLLGTFQGAEKEERKADYNKALREAHKLAKSKESNSSIQTKINRLSDIGSEMDKFECLELLMDVMVADGVMHETQLEFINQIGQKLDVDPKLISSMRDTRILEVDNLQSTTSNLEDILGIDTTKSDSEIREDLAVLFSQWNSRVESLTDETEKEKANQMLELIAQARNKYKSE